MINAQMKSYNFYLYDEEADIYGQKTLIKNAEGEPEIQGTVQMSITHTDTRIQQDIKYIDATYFGLTHDKSINDRYVIQYGDERLKVLYVIREGRYSQVFMNVI
jgi:hypothetical protein